MFPAETSQVGVQVVVLLWWFYSGYLYKFDVFLEKKNALEVNLGESVMLELSDKLKNIFGISYFHNCFNSPFLMDKLGADAPNETREGD